MKNTAMVIDVTTRILYGALAIMTFMFSMIPPDAQRAMSKRAGSTVVEVKGSHAVYVSQPQAVAHLIEKAATGASAAGQEKTK